MTEIKNSFDPADTQEVLARLDQLTPETPRQWGKMNPAQMLAHLNVAYEMAYENKHPKPNAFVKFFLKLLVKETVCGSKAYQKGSRTAPAFLITTERDFNVEKKRLSDYIKKTQELGAKYFDGRESNSFGPLTTAEWNVMFYKHLDHHFRQFGI